MRSNGFACDSDRGTEMKAQEPPLSGYTIERILSTNQELSARAAEVNEAEHGALRFGWDWEIIDEKVFEVKISVAVEPSLDRPEFMATNVIGRFRQVSGEPSISREEFAGLQAVAILLPYARQFLSS